MDEFKKLIEKLKDIWNNQSKRRIIENSAIIIIIGVIIIIAGGSFFGGNEATNSNKTAVGASESQETGKILNLEEKVELEKRIEDFLSQIDGAGNVNVMITYVSGKEIVPATDTKKTENDTQEKDSSGGTRSTKQNNFESKIVYEEMQGGGKKPIIIKEIHPPVKGVVVVADGAKEPKVRESLMKAVQVLVDVPIHKIQILERKR